MLCSWISHCYMNIFLSYVRLQKALPKYYCSVFMRYQYSRTNYFGFLWSRCRWPFIFDPLITSTFTEKLDILFSNHHPTTKYEDSHITLNFDSLTAVIEGTATSFTPLEFKLLKLLSLNPNTVLTRQHLLYSLWDRNGNYVEETSLNSMICRIRQRIDTENHHYIKTIYGIGYMWSTY